MRKLIADHLQSFFYATTFEYENYNVISSIANVLFTINISPLLDKHNRPPIDFADDLFIANYYYLIGNRLINFLLGYWKEVIRSGLPIDESYMVDATYLLNCFRLYAQLCCCLEKYYDVKDFYIMFDEIIYCLPHSSVLIKLMKVYFVLAIDNIDDMEKKEKKQLKKTVLAKKESFKGEALFFRGSHAIMIGIVSLIKMIPYYLKLFFTLLVMLSEYAFALPLLLKLIRIGKSSKHTFLKLKREELKKYEDKLESLIDKYETKEKTGFTAYLANEYIKAYLGIANLYGMSGNVAEAIELIKKFEHRFVQRQKPGEPSLLMRENSNHIIEVYKGLAMAYYSIGYYEESKKYLPLAIDIYDNLPGDHENEKMQLRIEYADKSIDVNDFELAVTCADIVFEWLFQAKNQGNYPAIDYCFQLVNIYLSVVLDTVISTGKFNQEHILGMLR